MKEIVLFTGLIKSEKIFFSNLLHNVQCTRSSRVLRFAVNVLFLPTARTSFGPSALSGADFAWLNVRNVGGRLAVTHCTHAMQLSLPNSDSDAGTGRSPGRCTPPASSTASCTGRPSQRPRSAGRRGTCTAPATTDSTAKSVRHGTNLLPLGQASSLSFWGVILVVVGNLKK